MNWPGHDVEGGGLTPFSLGFVKGWRRTLACLTCLEGIYTLNVPVEDLTVDFKADGIIALNKLTS